MSRLAHVLVVDDEKNMRATLAEILQEEGYEVDTADSGEAAVECCRNSAYRAILMDVRMPGISGVEACRIIRLGRSDARIILMSAYSAEDVKRIAMDEGAVAFLPKPLDLDSVVSVIEG